MSSAMPPDPPSTDKLTEENAAESDDDEARPAFGPGGVAAEKSQILGLLNGMLHKTSSAPKQADGVASQNRPPTSNAPCSFFSKLSWARRPLNVRYDPTSCKLASRNLEIELKERPAQRPSNTKRVARKTEHMYTKKKVSKPKKEPSRPPPVNYLASGDQKSFINVGNSWKGLFTSDAKALLRKQQDAVETTNTSEGPDKQTAAVSETFSFGFGVGPPEEPTASDIRPVEVTTSGSMVLNLVVKPQGPPAKKQGTRKQTRSRDESRPLPSAQLGSDFWSGGATTQLPRKSDPAGDTDSDEERLLKRQRLTKDFKRKSKSARQSRQNSKKPARGRGRR